jgi:hypothetical protein
MAEKQVFETPSTAGGGQSGPDLQHAPRGFQRRQSQSWTGNAQPALHGLLAPRLTGAALLEHHLLMRLVTDAVLDSHTPPPVELLKARRCRLGRRLSEHGDEIAGADAPRLKELHEQVHGQAKRVLAAHKAGDREAALGTLLKFAETNSELCLFIASILTDAAGEEAGPSEGIVCVE